MINVEQREWTFKTNISRYKLLNLKKLQKKYQGSEFSGALQKDLRT